MAELEYTCSYSDLPSPMAYDASQPDVSNEVTSKEPLSQFPFKMDEIDRIIQMAWEDRTPFEAIKYQFELSEKMLILLMRKYMKRASFNRWRKRVAARKSKHLYLRNISINRFKSSAQKPMGNKVAKR